MNADNITRADTIIDEVLARDEFNGGSDRVGVNWLVEIIKKIYKFLEDLFKKFWEWLSKLLEKLHFNFGGAGEGAKTIEVIAKIVIIVLGAAALVLLTLLIIRLLRGRRKKIAELEESEELAAFASDPDAAFQLAQRFRAEGDCRMAFRYLFINLLTEFNRREVIRIAKYKTNRSYLREAEASGKIDSGAVSPFFNTFNRVWYGGKPLKSEALEEFFEKRTAVLASIDAGSGEKGGGGNG